MAAAPAPVVCALWFSQVCSWVAFHHRGFIAASSFPVWARRRDWYKLEKKEKKKEKRKKTKGKREEIPTLERLEGERPG
jgi:hypothetical protein